MPSNLFIFAGEVSGDLHGGNLLKALRKHHPGFHISGVGGPSMREEKIDLILPMEDFQVMGFVAIAMALPGIARRFHIVRKHILDNNPRAVILIDYPGFNLRLAKSLRKHGYTGKIIQFISPTIWAWGKNRITTMEENLDLLISILPFEKEYFNDTSLHVEYVGHPLIDTIKEYPYRDEWRDLFAIKNDKDLLALFPGSRHSEITKNLPNQLSAAQRLQEIVPNLQVAVSCADDRHLSTIGQILYRHRKSMPIIPKQYSYELMRDATTAIATCGTATLELALHKTPTLVTYHVSTLNRLILRYCTDLNIFHYSLANILTKRVVFPELVLRRFDLNKATQHLIKLHNDKDARQRCLDHCQDIYDILDADDVIENTASAIEALL